MCPQPAKNAPSSANAFVFMALMLLQVLFLGVIAAAVDDVPLTWYWTSRAAVPCVVPDAARVRRPPPLLLEEAPHANPYSWRLDDEEYYPNRVLPNGTLEVRRREASDGVLQCAVDTRAGTVLGYPIQLKTAHLEKFSIHPENTTARLGQPVALSCIINSSPPAVISWSRDGKNLPKQDRYFLLKNQLLIIDVRQNDGGLYRCTATNTHLNKNRISHGGRLKVQPSEPLEPSFITTFEEREVMVAQGMEVRLSCPVTGWPRPELSWELRSPDGYTSVLDGSSQVLIRSDMQPHQAGVYTCKVKGRSDLEKSFSVTVTKPANITLPPASKEVLRASNVRFNCSADGRPAPNVTWYKDGAPLTIAGRIGLRKPSENDRLAGQLIISSVTSEDAGVYQCFASNKVSAASAWASLGVSGAGAAPPGRVRCEPVGAREVAVRWRPVPESVVAYTVHTTPQGVQGKSLPGQPHINTQEIVTNLEALTPYQFQVRAYGKTAATDFSEGVVCQGQGVPIKLIKLDGESVLVSWRQFAEQSGGVLQWLLQWRRAAGDQEHNVTLDAAATNYTLPLEEDVPLQVRVLGTRTQPWLQQNLTRVPWHSADLSGDLSVIPRDLEVTQVGPQGFQVRWQTDEVAPGQYQSLVCVTKVLDGSEECQPTDKNSVTMVNLLPDTEYEVRVQTRIPGREPVEAVLPDHVTTLAEGSDLFKLTYKYVNATTLRVSWNGPPGRYTVRYSSHQELPKREWASVTTTGNTVLIPGVDPGVETYVMVLGTDSTPSQVLRVPPQIRDLDAKDLTYVYTNNGITVSWIGAGPRVVRFAQSITQPLETWHLVNVTETHVQLAGLDPSLATFVTVTAPGSGRPSQVLTIPARPADEWLWRSITIGVGVSCLLCVLLLLAVAAICIWRRRKMAQSPARSRRRNMSSPEAHEGESSEMKSVGGRLANGGAAQPLLNGHVHITENPTSKTPNGKMRKARYEAFDVSRHDADTTADTVLDADLGLGLGLLDTSRRPDDTTRSISTNNSFNKLPDDNMNSEITRSDFALDSSKLQPTLQPNG